MSLDIFIGFKEEPKGLGEFLINEGYTLIEKFAEDEDTTYFREDNSWPQAIYTIPPIPVEEEDEVPNWEESGFKIVAELDINYPLGTGDAVALEARRLAEKVADRFNAVLYDSTHEEYF